MRARAIERLEHVTRRTVEVLMAELPYVTLLLRVRGNTDTERWAMERRREFDQRVAELLKAAAADGDLRADVDVRLATRLLFGMINSIVEWYRPRRRGGTSERTRSPTRSCGWPSRGCARPDATPAAEAPAPGRSRRLRRRAGLRSCQPVPRGSRSVLLEHQQRAGAEHLRDRLDPGEDQLAQRPVVRGVHQQQDVEVAADQRDVGGARQLPELLAHGAPGVLHDLQRDVGGGALTCAFLVDPGAEAADHAVLDQAVDARVGVGARDMDPFGHGAYRGAAVRLEHAQDVAVDGVERARRRAVDAAAVPAFGHLFSCHVRPASPPWTYCLHHRLWRTVCPQAEAACSQNVPTTEQSVGEAHHTRVHRLPVAAPTGWHRQEVLDMTVLEQPGARTGPTPPPAWQPRIDPAPLLPDAEPYRVLGTDAAADGRPRAAAPAVRRAGARPPVQRAGHRPHPAGPARRLPVQHRPGGLRGRRRAGPARSGTGSSPATATPSPPWPAASTPSRR